MPNKVTLFSSEYDSHGRQINGRNTFLTSFVLPVKTDLNKIKLMTVVDSKIKSIFNRNKLKLDKMNFKMKGLRIGYFNYFFFLDVENLPIWTYKSTLVLLTSVYDSKSSYFSKRKKTLIETHI